TSVRPTCEVQFDAELTRVIRSRHPVLRGNRPRILPPQSSPPQVATGQQRTPQKILPPARSLVACPTPSRGQALRRNDGARAPRCGQGESRRRPADEGSRAEMTRPPPASTSMPADGTMG